MTQPSSRFPSGRYSRTWWQLYEAAILEPDDQYLPHRIQSAVQAINTRRVELTDSQDDGREQRALIEARNALAVLEILYEYEGEDGLKKPLQPRAAS